LNSELSPYALFSADYYLQARTSFRLALQAATPRLISPSPLSLAATEYRRHAIFSDFLPSRRYRDADDDAFRAPCHAAAAEMPAADSREIIFAMPRAESAFGR